MNVIPGKPVVGDYVRVKADAEIKKHEEAITEDYPAMVRGKIARVIEVSKGSLVLWLQSTSEEVVTPETFRASAGDVDLIARDGAPLASVNDLLEEVESQE